MIDSKTRASQLAAALADPIRLAILEQLLTGPAAVSQLTGVLGATQSNVSNHLAVLRRAEAVTGARSGRQITYRLKNSNVAQIVEALLTASAAGPAPPAASPMAEARTCYDHLAGRLGVVLFDHLVATKSIMRPDDAGVVGLGPGGTAAWKRLGVDLGAPAAARRRFALACLDWTEARPHLGGALGAALCRRFLEAGWVETQRGTRALLLTAKGRRALRRLEVPFP